MSTKVTPYIEPINCIVCKATIRPGDRYCGKCGALQEINKETDTTWALQDARTVKLQEPLLSQLRTGSVFAERFRVRRNLGSGGMGHVFLVEDIQTKQNMALKILKPTLLKDPNAVKRFQREIRLLAKVQHPSIPKIFEWGQSNDALFFLTDFIDGKDLRTALDQKGAWSSNDSVKLVSAIADALGCAHQSGVIHRDIKPQNIMIGQNETVYLIDFGVARGVDSEISTLTKSGFFVGTPQYMAPEQLDSRRVDERSDIYSLGIVFFELLTGVRPFDGDTPMSIATKHLQNPPPSPRSLNPSIPFWIESVVLRCLEKSPADRFWTTGELISELEKHHHAAARRKNFPNGDTAVEDPSGSKGWVLSIYTPIQKTGWARDVAVYYKDQYYVVKSVEPPNKTNRWVYRFDIWPENVILRRVVDYESEASIKHQALSILEKGKRWLTGRG